VYLTIFKTVLHTAYKEEILPTDLTLKIEAIKGEETQRVYLTEKELQQLANTPCRNDDTRRAALFSALTGLRYSDILKLTWGEIDSTEMRIEFRQKKTKSVVYLPISQYALTLCGERKNDNIPVFSKLPDSKLVSTTIAAWVKSAGINKHITFHCFRHTFATLQLSKGTDIYTVSKMLGHNDVKTTQIYAQVIDEKKQVAANAIKLDI
jgi:integrase